MSQARWDHPIQSHSEKEMSNGRSEDFIFNCEIVMHCEFILKDALSDILSHVP